MDRRAHVTPTQKAARWLYTNWLGLAVGLIALALILTLALLPGPSAGSLTSPSVGTSPGPAPSSSPAWPAVPTTTTTAPAPSSSTQPAPVSAPTTATATPQATSAGFGDCGPPYNPTDGTGVSCAQFEAWSSVASCEEGGWGNYAEGPSYYGSLGESSALWDGFPQYDRTNATPDEQIVVGLSVVGGNTPDQGRCNGSW